jgi:hypothetical protein
MLRLVLLLLYLSAMFSISQPSEIGGGLDPDGRPALSPSDWGGGLDPNGLTAPPPSDSGGGLDPNG